MLAALEAVDLVVIFEEDTPIDLITRIKPSVLVKGGDYTREQVVGHEVVEAAGGTVVLVDILQGFSTTALVHRARGETASDGARAGVDAARRRCGALRSPAAWSETVDLFAILTAASLPWSTSLAAIFNVAMLALHGAVSRRRATSCSR